MALFTGSGVALVTPYKNGQIDFDKLGELIEWHIDNNTDAIIICGTTGEASTMTDEEKKQTIKFTVEKVNKRIPVIAGTGSNNTKHAIELSVYAESIGADGLLIVTPYYNKTTQKGLIEHYLAIANEVNIPIIVYNVPGRTGLNIKPNTVAKLSEHPNIKAIKEASGNISQVAEIARLCPEDFYIYSGNDDMVVPLLSLGGKGVISVVANILPKDTHNMVMYYLNGDIDNARKIQLKMKGLIDALFIETNPIPIKTAMNLLGMDVGELRLPLTTMSEDNLQRLIREMEDYGLSPRR
ncbi:4-hydroxy-tetrahydrodipicolinate synthase [Caloranaerobacter azorensis DSM 13643]|uniref:4-hydroxy-tetrahydrodipicolinate synthase n=1 Tax=Caloranaerobacter azorensis DSM 13643 TaxID=1121264 RepID=A0A1M5RAP6_9FIRM|nr:4-hydroxy-tetrahydrodipicolinate synthase [Caloranaerobacter azorensis]SHH23422.1 4-hydroxy-tetrahydrodipicolinate synthase [Caloranaerobacter azorensis DSM 13643]